MGDNSAPQPNKILMYFLNFYTSLQTLGKMIASTVSSLN